MILIVTYGLLSTTTEPVHTPLFSWLFKSPQHYLKMLNIKLPQYVDRMCLSAYFTIFCVLGITLFITHKHAFEIPTLLVTGLFVFYGFTFHLTHYFASTQNTKLSHASLIAMLLTAFSLNYLLPFEYISILTIIWASVLAFFVRYLTALAITLGVVIVWFSLSAYWHERALWISALLYGTFHLFALLMSSAYRNESIAHQALAAKNLELITTQQLLSEYSKQEERLRISRDIHDTLGHNLTALSIKLQLASRLSSDQAKSEIDDCYNLVKTILSDIRGAVSEWRSYEHPNVKSAVLLLLEGAPNISSELTFNLDQEIPVKMAHNVLMCIQEAITNTLKHSGARSIYLDISNNNDQLCIHYSDNGTVVSNFKSGNGLNGMRERVEEFQGTIDFTIKDRGLHIQICLPIISTSAH